MNNSNNTINMWCQYSVNGDNLTKPNIGKPKLNAYNDTIVITVKFIKNSITLNKLNGKQIVYKDISPE